MTFSFIVGNFGGLVDSLSLSMFSAFMRTFWMKTESLLSVEYHALSSRLIIPKLTYSGYLKSPLSQNWLELLVLGWLVVKYLIKPKTGTKKSYAIKMSLKVLFYPLMLSSIHTIINMAFAQIFTPFGIFSLAISIGLFVSLGYTMLFVKLSVSGEGIAPPKLTDVTIQVDDIQPHKSIQDHSSLTPEPQPTIE